jgi:hypothetical protein
MFLFTYLTNNKLKRKETTKEYLNDVDEKFLAFKLLPIKEKYKFLELMISQKHEVVNKQNFTYQKEKIIHQIIVATEHEKITQNTLVSLLQNLENETQIFEIICNESDPNLSLKLLKNVSIKIITKKTLYDEFFNTYFMFPDCSNLNTEKQPLNFKKIFKNFFLPNKSKSYFLCGLILIFSSIILPYHYYYLITGSLLLIFSIICKLKLFFK